MPQHEQPVMVLPERLPQVAQVPRDFTEADGHEEKAQRDEDHEGGLDIDHGVSMALGGTLVRTISSSSALSTNCRSVWAMSPPCCATSSHHSNIPLPSSKQSTRNWRCASPRRWT